MKNKLILPIILILSILGSIHSQPRVLILHSYHIADWTKGLGNGIDAGLKDFHSIELFIEYMDAKKNSSPYYLDLLYQIYLTKFSTTKFDLIITTDNNAFDFILAHRDGLFKEVPVVFCGVNAFDSSVLTGFKNITGVVEQADFAQTIDIAFKARPNCDTIFIIDDRTETGLINKQEFMKALALKNKSVLTKSFQDLSYEDLGKQLKEIRKQDIVLFIAFWKDKNGITITPQNLETIFGQCNAPIFGRSEWMVNRGMVGGMCVTGYSQGYAAAQLASRILHGESADQISIIKNSPNKYIFNYTKLKANNISLKIIPKESIITNKPFPIEFSFQIMILLVIIVFLLIVSIVLLFIYIKMRNRSMRSLEESEEKYRELIKGTDLLVIKLTIGGVVTFINQNSDKFLGFTSTYCIGKKFVDFVHVEDQEIATLKLFEWVNQKPSVNTFENRMINASGKVFHFLWTITAIKDENGKFIGLNSIGRDISSYKEIQNQLQHASKMKAIGTLAGGIAHDFNNLLAGILGYAEVTLLELPDTHTSRSHIIEIRKISMRARELIRHILTFSRQTPFEPYPVLVHEIVEEVIPMLRATLPSTIEIQTKITNCGTILADQTRVYQIIMNLCTNSFHAMEERGGILTLTLQLIDMQDNNNLEIKAGKYILLSIKDTGIGIPTELQTHIFDPFFTTKKVNKGTGLGLSVVHGIVTELNSFIRFKSEPGKGSTFTIYFPLSLNKSSASVEVRNEIIPGGNENIIIVDDEEIVAGSLNAVLKKHGYRTCVFTSSKLAFEMIRSKKIRGDLLITDMTMPEMTGIELIQGLSAIVPDLPVILCTGYSDQSKIDATRGVTIAAFLTKPIDMRILLTTIRTVLNNKKITPTSLGVK